MENWLYRWFDKWRKASLKRGYACDLCGGELFDYPTHRLCKGCEEKLRPIRRPCPLCGRESVAEGLCLDCKAEPPSFTRGLSSFEYKGEGALAVNRLKNGEPRLAAYFGEKMAETFLCAVNEVENLLILPVPSTKEGVRERGYNQAERLAESVCDYLSLRGVRATLDGEVLQKIRETKPQKQMTRRERSENVKGAYRLHKRKVCEGRTVLLIDDILTTGSTGNECAKKIKAAGAKEVYFLTAFSVAEAK